MDHNEFMSNTLLGMIDFGFISFLLYPLERVQMIKQIQSTYSNLTLKQLKNVFTQCTHFGVRATFRGFKSNLLKTSIVYSAYQLWNNHLILGDNTPAKIIKSIIMAASYTMAYPFQTIKTRMSADIQQDRFYKNLRECIRKIRKNQGAIAFYRGYLVGITQFGAQLALFNALFKYRQQNFKQITYVQFLLFFGIFSGFQVLNYPIDTLKKLKQINGSLGHSNQYGKIRNIIKQTSISEFYKGFPIRLLNSFLYTSLILFIGQRAKPAKY